MGDNLEAVVQKRMAWFNALSEEDQGKVKADKQAMMASEETKEARQAEMTATFQTADTN